MIKQPVSIYEIYSRSTKRLVLVICALLGFLTPFADTIYFPAQGQVITNLNTNAQLVSLSVSLFFGLAACGQLFWGPSSDHFGRKKTAIAGLVAFELCTIGCYFSPNIICLIVMRSLQGFAVGSCISSASAIVNDVFAPAERGTAVASFVGPLLFGPVIAPVIGGVLANAYSWQSTMILLFVLGALTLILIIFFLPESQHFFSVSAFELKRSDSYVEGNMGKNQTPFLNPLDTLKFFYDPKLYYIFAYQAFAFSNMITSLTIMPVFFAQSPYNLDAATIGLLFIPSGIVSLLTAFIAGPLCDFSAKKFPDTPSGRLIYCLPFVIMLPIGSLGFGFSFALQAPVFVIIIFVCIICFGNTIMFPAVTAYLSQTYPEFTGVTASVANFITFFLSMIAISVSIQLSLILGVNVYFSILAGLLTLSYILLVYKTVKNVFGVKDVVKEDVHAKEMMEVDIVIREPKTADV